MGHRNGVIGEGRRCNVVPTVRKDRPHDLKQWYNDDDLPEPVKKRYQLRSYSRINMLDSNHRGGRQVQTFMLALLEATMEFRGH